jgi:hypothetical protein
MSSGWNGIPIRGVGKTRHKLAEMLCQLTGVLVEAEDLQRTNPNHRHWEDCCAWDCWGTRPAKGTVPAHKVHIYSWDTMTACVKHGIVLVGNASDHQASPCDIEVCRKG